MTITAFRPFRSVLRPLGAISLILIVGASTQAYAQSPKLLFRSGFESRTALANNGQRIDTKRYRNKAQRLTGVDSRAGFSWPTIALGGAPKGLLNINGVFRNTIANGAGYGGSRGLKLSMERRYGGTAQTGYYVEGATQQARYMQYKIRLPADFARRMRNGGQRWRSFWFLKTAGDYRIVLYVYLNRNGQPYWHAHGDNHANGVSPRPNGSCVAWNSDGKYERSKDYRMYWSRNASSVPVPQDGQWHTLGLFWNMSETRGRFALSVDGRVAIDYRGSTRPRIREGTPYCNDPKRRRHRHARVSRIGMGWLYGGGQLPVEQWIDDVEIWDRPPAQASIKY